MEKFILPAQEIPAVLYRVQHRWYYVPPCGYVTRGVYALNIIEKEPSTLKNLVKEVNNHMWLTIPPRGYVGTIWPSPFVSVYSTWEDAENSLRVRGGKPGDGMWRVFEVSGKKVAATGCKVMRMKDIKGTDDVPESELLIWRFIPEEAFVRTYPWTGPPKPADPMEEEAEKPVSPGTTHNSQGRRSADSGASRLPEGYYRINALLDHLPAKARRENVKWYKVRWEEDRQVEWVAAEDVSEAAIEVYWENVTTRRIKRKGSKYELK